jgi:hypothetical protein
MESTPKFRRLSQYPLPGIDVYTYAAVEKLCLEEFGLFAFVVCYLETLSASRKISSMIGRLINTKQLVEGELAEETGVLWGDLPQCHFDCHNFLMISYGIEAGPPGGKTATNHLSYWLGLIINNWIINTVLHYLLIPHIYYNGSTETAKHKWTGYLEEELCPPFNLWIRSSFQLTA